MRRLVAVDRDAGALQAGRGAARARSAVRPRPPVVIEHCMPASRMARTIVQPVVAQVGLAADDRDLQDAERGHLRDQIEALGGVELVRAGAAGARAAVPAGEVALAA